MERTPPTPPRLAEWILVRSLPAGLSADGVIGDLREEYRQRLPSGLFRTNLWYWGQALSVGARFARDHAGRTRTRGDAMLPQLRQDLRHALRLLVRSPGFSIVAVFTMALGIGSTTAIASVVRHVLLRPLPYDAPDRVVQLLGVRDGTVGRGTISYPNAFDIRQRGTAFTTLAAFDEWAPTFRTEDGAERIAGASVNASFFDVLGVRPSHGRFFLPEEDEIGHAPVVVVSHRFWTSRLASDPDAVGRSLDLSGTPYTIVGVTPPSFEDPQLQGDRWESPLVWRATPSYFDPLQAPRDGRSFVAVARLRDDVSIPTAQQDLDAVMSALAREYPADNTGRSMRIAPLKDLIVGPVRPIVWVLAGAVTLVLIIACSNVASLLLSRGAARRGEFALRRALGASRGALIRQLVVESVVISGVAALLGIGLAAGAIRMLVALGGASIPRSELIALDPAIVAFTAAVAVMTGLGFGLAPAWRSTDFAGGMRAGRGIASPREVQRLHSTITGAEIALAMMLLTGAGMLLRSYWNLTRIDPGIAIEGALTFQVTPPSSRYPEAPDVMRVHETLQANFAAIPGVVTAGAVHILPMSGGFSCDGVRRDDLPPPQPGEGRCAEARTVTADYFRAMGITLRRGRAFTAGDDSSMTPVAVVNDRFADTFFGDEPVIGASVTIHGTSRQIVGVVGNVRLFGPAEQPRDAIYIPYAQEPTRALYAVLRTDGDPIAVAPSVRAAVRNVDPAIPLSEIRSLETVLAGVLARPRFNTVLLLVLSVSAVALAAVGIAAMMAYAVTHRFREIGVRMALGARGRDILRLIAVRGAAVALAGVTVGALGALAASGLLGHLLFEVSTRDGWSMLAAAAFILITAVGAAAIPSHRAATANVNTLLRTGADGG